MLRVLIQRAPEIGERAVEVVAILAQQAAHVEDIRGASSERHGRSAAPHSRVARIALGAREREIPPSAVAALLSAGAAAAAARNRRNSAMRGRRAVPEALEHDRHRPWARRGGEGAHRDGPEEEAVRSVFARYYPL